MAVAGKFHCVSLCFPFQLDMREQLSITDYKGKEIGYLNVSTVTHHMYIQITSICNKLLKIQITHPWRPC